MDFKLDVPHTYIISKLNIYLLALSLVAEQARLEWTRRAERRVKVKILAAKEFRWN